MFINSKFFNCNWRYVFLVLALFSVIVSGGCGGSSGGGGGSSSSGGNNPGGSGGSSSVDWVSMSGTWKPVSGDFIFYDNSGNTVVTYVLDPYRSTNFEVTISGSGSSYNLKCLSGTFYFIHESGTGSGAGGIGDDQLSNFSDTFAVSGKKLVKNFSYGSAHGTASFEFVDDNHVIFVADETGYESELDEGAVRSVKTVYVERVGSSNENDNENNHENTNENANNETVDLVVPSDWTSLSGTWKIIDGSGVEYDSAGNVLYDSNGNPYILELYRGSLEFSGTTNLQIVRSNEAYDVTFEGGDYSLEAVNSSWSGHCELWSKKYTFSASEKSLLHEGTYLAGDGQTSYTGNRRAMIQYLGNSHLRYVENSEISEGKRVMTIEFERVE